MGSVGTWRVPRSIQAKQSMFPAVVRQLLQKFFSRLQFRSQNFVCRLHDGRKRLFVHVLRKRFHTLPNHESLVHDITIATRKNVVVQEALANGRLRAAPVGFCLSVVHRAPLPQIRCLPHLSHDTRKHSSPPVHPLTRSVTENVPPHLHFGCKLSKNCISRSSDTTP